MLTDYAATLVSAEWTQHSSASREKRNIKGSYISVIANCTSGKNILFHASIQKDIRFITVERLLKILLNYSGLDFAWNSLGNHSQVIGTLSFRVCVCLFLSFIYKMATIHNTCIIYPLDYHQNQNILMGVKLCYMPMIL